MGARILLRVIFFLFGVPCSDDASSDNRAFLKFLCYLFLMLGGQDREEEFCLYLCMDRVCLEKSVSVVSHHYWQLSERDLVA
jgi:hypothetical protein